MENRKANTPVALRKMIGGTMYILEGVISLRWTRCGRRSKDHSAASRKHQKKAEKGMKNDAKEAREKAKAEQENVIRKRREERKEMEEGKAESRRQKRSLCLGIKSVFAGKCKCEKGMRKINYVANS